MLNRSLRRALFIGQRWAGSMEPGPIDHGPDRRHAPTRGEVVLLVDLAAIIRIADGTGRLLGHRHPCGVTPISRSCLHHRLLGCCSTESGASDLAAGFKGRCIDRANGQRRDLHPSAARMTRNSASSPRVVLRLERGVERRAWGVLHRRAEMPQRASTPVGWSTNTSCRNSGERKT